MRTGESAIHLSGITWNHTRGLLPMQATAQRFCELHPNIDILWQKRSLQQFADTPMSDLASGFDLLVIDHPSIGEAAHNDLLLPLDKQLPAEFLTDQDANTVGASHRSYHYNGHQYALAVDAAAPVSGWRPDLLSRADAQLPQTWDDLLALARRRVVTVPAIPIDSLMNLFMLANAFDAEPFTDPDHVIPSRLAGVEALRLLRELVQQAAPGSLERNPIKTWQLLATSEAIAYCPFAYGYSNYSRDGYAMHTVQTGGLISLNGKQLRSTLGGAGLAISKHCKHPEAAVEYALFVASGETQRTLYTFSGGQPGHRAAWLDRNINAHAHDFFRNTLSTLDAAWVRPRFPGFIGFQDAASAIVHDYLVQGGSEQSVLERMDAALHQHRLPGASA